MRKTTIGIVGCGAAAQRYYAPILKKHGSSINILLIDHSHDRAERLRDNIGEGEIFHDFHDILNKADGVVIALPHNLHFPVSLKFLKTGTNVLCEKPLTETKTDAEILIKAAKVKNVELCVNNTRRLFPSFQSIKNSISKGKIGHIKSIDYYEGNIFAWDNSTGFYVDPQKTDKGVLLDLGAHVLDTICWWTEKDFQITSYRDDSFGGPESVATIELASDDLKVKVFLNRLCDIKSRFIIKGDEGTLSGNSYELCKHSFQSKSGKTTIEKIRGENSIQKLAGKVLDNFIDVVRNNEQPLIRGSEVLNSITLIENCYQKRTTKFTSVHTKHTPKLSGKILVTGASGFVGGSLIETLSRNNVHNLRAGIRKWSSAARIGRFKVDIAPLDILDTDQIKKALEDVSHVVHCAYGKDGATVEGTRNLLDACLNQKITRFVHLSTTEVYGDVSGKVDENTPVQYTKNQYNRSKIDAENLCLEYFEKGIPISILRPHVIYGPFNRNWTINFAKLFLSGKGGLYENYGEGLCNLIYIDDLLDAIFLTLQNDNAIGQVFNVSGPDVITWNDYFKRFNDSMGLSPLRTITHREAILKYTTTIPLRIVGTFLRDYFIQPLKKIAELSDNLNQTMRSTENLLKTTLTNEQLSLFKKDAEYSWEKANNMLGYKPITTIDRGLEFTVKWLKDQGILV